MGAIRPTLELMAEVYRLPTERRSPSPRFSRYIELRRNLHPINHYNPFDQPWGSAGHGGGAERRWTPEV